MIVKKKIMNFIIKGEKMARKLEGKIETDTPQGDVEGKDSAILFKGYAKTVKMKKEFLAEYPKQKYKMKKTAYALGMTPGTVTSWCLDDQKFKDAYLELKAKRFRLPPKELSSRNYAKYSPTTPLSPEEVADLKEEFIKLFDQKQFSLAQCCKQIGLSMGLARNWLAGDPIFRKVYQQIANEKRGFTDEDGNFKPEIRDKAQAGIQAALAERQNLFLKTYLDTAFNITEACKVTGVMRSTFRLWLKKYPEFEERFSEAFESKKDFIEDKLLENIKANDSACIIHASKTLLRDRGYGEKQEIEISGKFGVMVVPGKVEDVASWAAKAVTQQRRLREASVHELHE